MQRYQVLLLAGGILVVLMLFFLPRSVVKNPEKTMSQTEEEKPTASKPITSGHIAEINPAKRTEIDLLIKGFQKRMNLESVEALAQAFREVSLFDSAAFYYGVLAEQKQDQASFCAAGSAYFEAFSLALREESLSHLTEKLRFYLQKCIDFSPKNFDARVKLGISYVSGKQPMVGIQMIKKVLEEDPKNTLAILNLGVFSMQSNQMDKAIERFKQLIEIEPENPQGYLYLGAASLQTGDKNTAKTSLQKAAELGKGTEVETVAKDYLAEIK
jgi:tetratricopeptide (TPR) repeat protein